MARCARSPGRFPAIFVLMVIDEVSATFETRPSELHYAGMAVDIEASDRLDEDGVIGLASTAVR